MTSSFDSLYTNLISEMMPVGSEFGDFSSSLEKGISSAPGDAYLIGAIAKALDISKEEVIKNISKSLFDKVFGETGVNPANTEEEYRSAIADALTDIIHEIKVGHPDAKIPGAAAIRGYTARVISGLGTTTKEFGEKATEADVTSAVEDASTEEEGTEEAPETEKPEVAPKTAAPAGFKPNKDYYLKSRDEIPAGTLKGDLEVIYNRLSGIAGETTTGSDIEKTLRKGGTEQGKISSYLRKMVEVGVLEPAESEGGAGGSEALEAGSENMRDVEQREFEKGFSHAYKDYMASGGGAGHGIDFG